MKFKFSIRYKFLVAMLALLMVSVGTYLLIATEIFKTDKSQVVFSLKQSLVTNLTSEFDGVLKQLNDKLKIVAYFYNQNKSKAVVDSILKSSDDIVFVGGSDRLNKIDHLIYESDDFLGTYGIKSTDDIVKNLKVPFNEIKTKGVAFWPVDTPGYPRMFGYGKNVLVEGARGIKHQFALISLLKTDRLTKIIEESTLNRLFIANGSGEVLLSHPKLKGQPQKEIFREAKTNPLSLQVKEFRNNKGAFLGAFSKTMLPGVFVLSQVSNKKAFSAVDQLVRRTFLFGAIILTLAFIIAILLSRSITRPMELLVEGMKKVARGDMDQQIFVRTRDEVSFLADNFNRMIADLRTSRSELEDLNKNLEQKVVERTKALEEQTLAVKKAQEDLLRATRLASIGETAGRAAHEILNPLTTLLGRVSKIKSYLTGPANNNLEQIPEMIGAWKKDYMSGSFEGLLREWKGESTVLKGKNLFEEDMINLETIMGKNFEMFKEMVGDSDYVIQEGQRISRIVNSMRTLTTAGENVDSHKLPEAIEHSIEIVKDLALEKNVTIDLEKFPESGIAFFDVDEMVQILTNLFRNSIQSFEDLEKTDKHIKISIKDELDYFSVFIEDNGCGIDNDLAEKLFSKQISTKPRSQGTGLGLSISRRFARSIGGDVYLKSSEPGSGSVFVLKVPKNNQHKRKTA